LELQNPDEMHSSQSQADLTLSSNHAQKGYYFIQLIFCNLSKLRLRQAKFFVGLLLLVLLLTATSKTLLCCTRLLNCLYWTYSCRYW